MKTILFAVQLILPLSLFAQSFQEICPTETINGTMVNFTEFENTIYATGFFSTICDQPTDYIATWNGSEWVANEWGLTDPGHALKVINDTLFIARYEESIDSNWVYFLKDGIPEKFGQGIYLTTASNFSNLPNIYDITEYNGRLFACGEFDRVGSEVVTGIMQWDGEKWTDVDGGLSANIPNTPPLLFPHQMIVFDGDLIVSGNFGKAGGQGVNGIAKWNGTWSPMGEGFNNTVYGLGIYNGELYAGGSFTASGSTPLDAIAKWNGTEWVSPGFGFTSSSVNDFTFVHTFLEQEGVLYIGGGLKSVIYEDGSTETCGGIVAFDGTTVNVFDGGIPNNDIEGIIFTEEGKLLVGGGVFGSGYAAINDLNTSANEAVLDSDIQIFPNPVKDQLNFSGIPAQDFPITARLFDQTGRLISTQILTAPYLDTNSLAEGINFIQIHTQSQVQSFKFIRSK